MKKYIFNARLFSMLPDLLQTTYTEIGETCGRNRSTIQRNMAKGNVRMTYLVDICNAYQIDIRRFFVPKGTEIDMENIVTPDDRWSRIVFDADDGIIQAVRFAKTLTPTLLDKAFTGGPFELPEKQPEQPITVDRSENSHQLHFHITLFKALPSIIGTSQTDMSRTCGHSAQMFVRALEKGDVRLLTLLDICNTYHINILNFFTEDDIIPDPVVTTDSWQDIHYHAERIRQIHAKESPFGYTYSELLDIFDWKPMTYQRNVSDSSPITAAAFCNMCNTLRIPPTYFFDAPEFVYKTNLQTGLQRQIESMRARIANLETENRSLQAKIRHLQSIIDMRN